MLSFVSGEFALLLRAKLPQRTFLSTLRKFRFILSFLNKEGGPLAVDGSKTKHLVELPTVFDGPPFFSRRDLFNS